MVHLVRKLPDLLQQLRQVPLPKAICMMGLLRDAMEGKLVKARFYTDAWPNFSAVVCEWGSPRVSDVADLNCYATSSEALLELMIRGKFLSWGKRQIIHNIETEHACYLVKHMSEDGESGGRLVSDYRGSIHILPREIAAKIEGYSPSGYKLGKLHPSHAKLIDNTYTYFKDWNNRESWFRDRIKLYNSVGAFCEKDGSLASWYTFMPGRELSHMFTLEEHRNRGLGYAVKAALCKTLLLQKEYFPGLSIIDDGNSSVRLCSKLGYISTGFYIDNLVITQKKENLQQPQNDGGITESVLSQNTSTAV